MGSGRKRWSESWGMNSSEQCRWSTEERESCWVWVANLCGECCSLCVWCVEEKEDDGLGVTHALRRTTHRMCLQRRVLGICCTSFLLRKRKKSKEIVRCCTACCTRLFSCSLLWRVLCSALPVVDCRRQRRRSTARVSGSLCYSSVHRKSGGTDDEEPSPMEKRMKRFIRLCHRWAFVNWLRMLPPTGGCRKAGC